MSPHVKARCHVFIGYTACVFMNMVVHMCSYDLAVHVLVAVSVSAFGIRSKQYTCIKCLGYKRWSKPPYMS